MKFQGITKGDYYGVPLMRLGGVWFGFPGLAEPKGDPLALLSRRKSLCRARLRAWPSGVEGTVETTEPPGDWPSRGSASASVVSLTTGKVEPHIEPPRLSSNRLHFTHGKRRYRRFSLSRCCDPG